MAPHNLFNSKDGYGIGKPTYEYSDSSFDLTSTVSRTYKELLIYPCY